MPEPAARPPWARHFFHRAEHTKSTWTFRFAALALVVAALWLTSARWTAALARGLVCDASLAPSDAILIENFDPDYLLFERARKIRQSGLAARVFVPIRTDGSASGLNAVALGTAEVMARVSRIGTIEAIPIREVEPISLNAARDVRQFLDRERIRSVILVTPLFRSRRSQLVYATALGSAGIAVRCEPVQGTRGVSDWAGSWHGIEDVVLQWLKLQYYRWYVLRFPSKHNGLTSARPF